MSKETIKPATPSQNAPEEAQGASARDWRRTVGSGSGEIFEAGEREREMETFDARRDDEDLWDYLHRNGIYLSAETREVIDREIGRAKREQMEADCRAVCQWCAIGLQAIPDRGGYFHTRDGTTSDYLACAASGIHRAKGQEEGEATR